MRAAGHGLHRPGPGVQREAGDADGGVRGAGGEVGAQAAEEGAGGLKGGKKLISVFFISRI